MLASGPLTGTRMLTVLSPDHPHRRRDHRPQHEADRSARRRRHRLPRPGRQTRLITHRLRSLRFSGNQAHVVTKGDANTGTEQWTMGKDGEVAVVRDRPPKLGYVLSWMRSFPGRIALVVIPAILLCACELRRIWMPPRPVHVQLRLFD